MFEYGYLDDEDSTVVGILASSMPADCMIMFCGLIILTACLRLHFLLFKLSCCSGENA